MIDPKKYPATYVFGEEVEPKMPVTLNAPHGCSFKVALYILRNWKTSRVE